MKKKTMLRFTVPRFSASYAGLASSAGSGSGTFKLEPLFRRWVEGVLAQAKVKGMLVEVTLTVLGRPASCK